MITLARYPKMTSNNQTLSMPSVRLLLVGACLVLLSGLLGSEARDKGEDIIMTKGKLIMRGGKGKGNIILDTGSKSGDHEGGMPMMMNPFAFYPMQQHHAPPPPPMVIHPVYIEDHSAMGKHEHQHVMHHEEPAQHHEHQEYHHEEPHHYQPQHHEEMAHYQHQHQHHEEPHQEHHQQHEHHEEEHHEPQHEHYEHEGHHHGGYETHPMVSMMMHGSGQQPIYDHRQQMAAMQAFQQPIMYHPAGMQRDPQQQAAAAYQHQQAFQQALQAHQHQLQGHQDDGQHQSDQAAASAGSHSQQGAQDVSSSASSQQSVGSKPNSPSSAAPSAPSEQSRPKTTLMAIIKPLFKRNPNKQKKP